MAKSDEFWLFPEFWTRFVNLAMSFPAAREGYDWAAAARLEGGRALFDPTALVSASATWSTGERYVVAFLLTLLDADQKYVPAFNINRAVATWDDDHRGAFAAWAAKPFVWQ